MTDSSNLLIMDMNQSDVNESLRHGNPLLSQETIELVIPEPTILLNAGSGSHRLRVTDREKQDSILEQVAAAKELATSSEAPSMKEVSQAAADGIQD